jgi:hypothetical protein
VIDVHARKLLAVACVVLAAALCAPIAAGAAVACDQTIYDNAGLLHNRRPATVAAAQRLASIGVEVRVIDLLTYQGFPSLAAYVGARERACASWQSSTGGWKPNLLVVVATVMERKIGIFYGPGTNLAAAFRKGGGTRRIAEGFIRPKIYQARWPAGFVAGLDEGFRVVDGHLHP